MIASWFRFSGTFRAPMTAPGLPSLAPTGGPLELFGMDRSEIRDGRLARHQIFWDIPEPRNLFAETDVASSRTGLSLRWGSRSAFRERLGDPLLGRSWPCPHANSTEDTGGRLGRLVPPPGRAPPFLIVSGQATSGLVCRRLLVRHRLSLSLSREAVALSVGQ